MALITIKKKDFIPESFERLVNSLLDDANKAPKRETREGGGRTFQPKTNILERDQEFEIQLALPGWEKQQVSISVDDDVLVIHGSKDELKKDGALWHRYEFDFGKFEKRFRLTEEVSDDIRAEMKNGVLHVLVKKAVRDSAQKTITVE